MLLRAVPIKEAEFKKLKEIGTEKALKRLEGHLEEIHIFHGVGKGIASLDS